MLLFAFGFLSLLNKEHIFYVYILVALINLSRPILFALNVKKDGVRIKRQERFTAKKINQYEIILLIYAFLSMVVNLENIIVFIIAFLIMLAYVVIYRENINNYKINFVLITVLIILNYFGIRGIISASVFSLVFMFIFKDNNLLSAN